MFVSAFDLFKVGLGPSSSHTVGLMRAARRFVPELAADGKLEQTAQVVVDLYGSLALTGRGHGTDRAVLLGLSGDTPDRIDPDQVEPKIRRIREQQTLALDGRHPIRFREQDHLRFRVDKTLTFHTKGMRFTAQDDHGAALARKVYYSIGGGFFVDEIEAQQLGDTVAPLHVPYAIAVNEENAAGSRVVTAPTNGAAGIVPAVIRYHREFYEDASDDGIVTFRLTAAAIGGLCKRNASISGAEVGCQGEVGVACSMAAAGLTAALGGLAVNVVEC